MSGARDANQYRLSAYLDAAVLGVNPASVKDWRPAARESRGIERASGNVRREICSMSNPITVLKFGSSILANEGLLPRAVQEIYRYVRQGHQVVAVVSAFSGETDRLLEHAKRYGDAADPSAVASLVALGEGHAVALLGLALDQAGVGVNVLDSAGMGLSTLGHAIDSKPTGLDVDNVKRALSQKPVLVVPGFIGRDEMGRVTLLGRGGSDYTALFIAGQLGAQQAVLIKDVDGLYDRDPATHGDQAKRFERVSYSEILQMPEGIVQHKAVRFAAEAGLHFGVGAAGQRVATWVWGGQSAFATKPLHVKPLKLALVGAGIVGRGVFDRVRNLSNFFEVTRVCVRDVAKHAASGIPKELLTTDWKAAIADADIVVETMGGLTPAKEVISTALAAGKHVVTANKAVLAQEFDTFTDLRRKSGARLLYGAAVGGGVPILEAVRAAARRGRIASVRGVVNGTTNFVLGQLAKGVEFTEAIRKAQVAGFAEPDPSADIDGHDAAAKACLIAREAFGHPIFPNQVKRMGISHLTPNHAAQAAAQGGAIRLVAHITCPRGMTHAAVAPLILPSDDPLAQVHDEQNCAVITMEDGSRVVVAGRGAGRWPTAESMVGDLFEIARGDNVADDEEYIGEVAA
jgi:homoserine dehydrogenase